MNTWTPNNLVRAWARGMVATLRDGGVWGAPGELQCYTFRHAAKRIELTTSADSAGARDWFEKVRITFAELGYTTHDVRPGAPFEEVTHGA